MKAARRLARQVALQTLFEVSQTGHEPATALDHRLDDADMEGADPRLAAVLVEGVLQHRPAVDEVVASAAPAWPIDQMSLTDRVALEIGVFELLYAQDAPVQVIINEAVELAKTFGGPNAASFVNGVLRTIAERAATHSSAE